MDMQSYLVFLSELQQALDALSALEQRKIAAVRAGNLDELDQCMKQEQAAALDLRGREQKRTALMKELGLEQVSLRALPDHCPPSTGDRLPSLPSRCCAAIRCSPAPRRRPAP